MTSSPSDDKQFFKIGEVAEIVGVKPHVLRYWEAEFGALRPLKTRGAHRMYRRADVELACLIRKLVHDEGFTIAGAKKRLKHLRGDTQAEAAERVAAAREVNLRAELLSVRAELQDALDSLVRPSPAPRRSTGTVTVNAVVPSRVIATARKSR